MEEIEDKLSEWLDDTNIFQILKLSRTEIRHSNFLAYLLSPHESHKWQDKFFKALLKTVFEDNANLNGVNKEKFYYLLCKQCYVENISEIIKDINLNY